MKYLHRIIKQCAAHIRSEMKALKNQYERLCPAMDQVIVQDISIKIEDVRQAQWDGRKNLWEVIFKEEYNDYDNLLKHIDKFTDIKSKEVRKDNEEWLRHLQAGTLHLYNFDKKR